MKYIFKIFTIVILASLLGCSSDDNVIDIVNNNTTRGAILRTIAVNSSEFDVFNPQSEFSVTLEFEDNRGGDLLESVDVVVSFDDRTDNGPDNSRDEAPLTTIPASAFSNGENNLPVITFNTSLGQAAQALGLTSDDYSGGDRFVVRFIANLTDGRSFSSGDANGGILSGSFTRSPYQYNVNLVCPPAPPASGTWTIEMTDLYGDGWNGGELVITIDGNESRFTMDNGASLTVNFEVPSGSQVISIQYSSGDWDEEVIFQIIASNGNTIMDIGPFPPVGVELIDYCNTNYQ
ncbi:hypothetical protein FJ651_08495 [Paucihalobacter ruber]|uniref:Uncharacterized protein n=1 Tax=Paucihalobacter ruber TaxID=2567861 RepID=A0A506PLJ4_9FLAO|nr:hypothetical protein [Paucihalobacter ruber]TPV34185.1 hypothetical protein FJ651_08495 [Paucihalobacter ruber]